MALTKVTSGVRTLGTGEVATANMATDPTNASNLSSGSVPLAQLGNVDTSGLEDDIALLGFRVASNGSLAKYNLVDQTVDDFQDTSGVDASASTDESRNSAGKYFSGVNEAAVTATGGTITTDGAYTIHSFTSTGTFTTDTAQSADLLVIAGGGGGGGYVGGGGGAGGYIATTGHSVTAASHTATVGTGGAGGSGQAGGTSGVNSQFASMTAAVGGGGGESYNNTGNQSGGSGGGSTSTTRSSGTVGQGNDSGQGTQSSSQDGGGGGGAGAQGGDGESTGVSPDNYGGDGGVGLSSSITGSAVFRAGGGGGGRGGAATTPTSAGDGGNGGGGDGSSGATADAATAGTANTGGGGGGGGHPATVGGAGGSGVVILRRPTVNVLSISDMTLVSTTTAAQAAPTKGDIVLTYTNGAGTTTLDTDLTAEISADGGGTWTALALGSEGSTGSHNIATSHNVTISSTITAPYNMAYRIKTLNQSVSKTTRIQAVSLGWS